MLWHKAQGAGGAGGEITGEFIESSHSDTGYVSLSSAPLAGDLLIAHSGGYSGGSTLTTTGSYAFTQVTGINSTSWSWPYFEGSRMGYRIATGSEGTSISVGTPDTALGVYRFSSPVTSVTSAFTATQQGNGSKTITTSSYAKPHIVACTIGSYQDPSLTMTNSDYNSEFVIVSDGS